MVTGCKIVMSGNRTNLFYYPKENTKTKEKNININEIVFYTKLKNNLLNLLNVIKVLNNKK